MNIKEKRREPVGACVGLGLLGWAGSGSVIVVVAAFLMALPVFSTVGGGRGLMALSWRVGGLMK